MRDLTLLIPAKKEKESLPTVLNELKKFDGEERLTSAHFDCASRVAKG